MEVIKKKIEEYAEDNKVYRNTEISFLGIPLFRSKEMSTNSSIVKQFEDIKSDKNKSKNNKRKIGFQNEN